MTMELSDGEQNRLDMDKYSLAALEKCSQQENESNTDNAVHDFELPNDFLLVPSIADGSCFFDSFRKGLNTLGKITSVEELRQKCKNFAQTDPPEWFIHSIYSSYGQDERVRKETRENYIENILCSSRWGDPDIEGRILCEDYKVSLYIIEKHEISGEEIYIYQIINEEGSKSVNKIDYEKENTVYMINKGKGHFEPILKISKVNHDQFLNLIYIENKDESQSKEKKDKNNLKENSIENKDKSKETNCFNLGINKSSDIEGQNQANLAVSSDTKRVILLTFNKFEDTIKNNDIDTLQKLIEFLYQRIERKTLLIKLYKENGNPVKNTHLITLACKYNTIKVLDFLLHKSSILCYLPPEDYNTYKNALCYTMRSNNIHMLEMLYDHWSGVIHWSGHMASSTIRDTIQRLMKLKKIFTDALNCCFIDLLKNQQMMVDVHCIIYFNSFQITLYSELAKLIIGNANGNGKDAPKDEVKLTIATILTIFRVYEKFSNKAINFQINRLRLQLKQLPNNILPQDEQTVRNLFKDERSLYMKYQLYLMYEVYYRKLDFSISLLIIDNLYVLKQRLQLPADTYQHLESALYYFIYRANEDWRLYLPQNRQKRIKTVTVAKSYTKTAIYDSGKLYNGFVIYLERIKFLKSLLKFKDSLESSVINVENNNNVRDKSTKLQNEEINSLLYLPYLRDDYSLKKILHYLEAISFVDFKNDRECSLLIIERIIQVIGELIKCTEESFHLSLATVILLQLEISKEVHKSLTNLRDEMSHVKNGKLLKRIELENNDGDIFEEVYKDLQKIKRNISEVIQTYKPILEKSLIQTGIYLIQERFAELPEEAKKYEQSIKAIYYLFDDNPQMYINQENSFMNEKWEKLGFSRALFREIGTMYLNIHELEHKLHSLDKNLIDVTLSKLPKHIKYIIHTLQAIEKDNHRWVSITKKLPIGIIDSDSDYPNTRDLTKIRKLVSERTIKCNKVNLIKDWTLQWEVIKQILALPIKEAGIFKNHHLERKVSKFSNLYQKICTGRPNKVGVENIKILLNHLNEKYNNKSISPILIDGQSYNYQGINRLLSKLKQNTFITKNEKQYLENHANCSCVCNLQNTSSCEHRDIFNKIYKHVLMSKKEYETIKSSKLNERSKRICENYFLGKKRDPKLLECLVNRMNLLQKFLGDTNVTATNQQVLRYKYDKKFRITIELILVDIMNILKTCKHSELIKKSSNLLKEINLRNVLEHGNPLLDVIGNALDSNDLPTELVKFALTIMKDEVCINHIHTYESFCQPDCHKCDSYSKLIALKQIKLDDNDDKDSLSKEEILMDAIKKRDKDAIQKIIDEGVNIDYIDRYDKAALHYAAMWGRTDFIEILLNNKADVNIANGEDGNRPLHYAFMNGHKDAQHVLITNGADLTLTNKSGIKPSDVTQNIRKVKKLKIN